MNHLIRILPLALLLLFAFQAKAEVFVVTSNQDSGPGTLREALQKAADNGDAETGYTAGYCALNHLRYWSNCESRKYGRLSS